ncbi:MAG: DUF4835 family protein [Bacteroidetes bacterium]|nr:DUF4835 family protein [Bacteroidota bacterium]
MSSFYGFAQEINCKVKVMRDKIQGVDKEVFASMERGITEFMNTRKWTNDLYQPAERIDCNILINLTAMPDQDIYEATLNIQATRPVYNTGYTSPIINFIDKEFKFKYNQYTQIQYDDNRVSGNDALTANLTATLAFYTYLILGLDYDSFSPNGGTELFKKAQNVVNNAPEYSKVIYGWKAVDGNKNRYWIIDQILSPRFKEFHNLWYSYHREGMDNMMTKPDESRKLMLETLSKIVVLNRENPSSILLQFYFNAKSDEYASLASQCEPGERTKYIAMLQQVDIANIQKYNNIK